VGRACPGILSRFTHQLVLTTTPAPKAVAQTSAPCETEAFTGNAAAFTAELAELREFAEATEKTIEIAVLCLCVLCGKMLGTRVCADEWKGLPLQVLLCSQLTTASLDVDASALANGHGESGRFDDVCERLDAVTGAGAPG